MMQDTGYEMQDVGTECRPCRMTRQDRRRRLEIGWQRMGRGCLAFCLLVMGLALHAAPTTRYPHIGYAYPAGGQVGTSVQFVVGGMNLLQIDKGMVTGDGVEVVAVRHFKPFERLSNDARRELLPIVRALKLGRDPIQAYTKAAEKYQKRQEQKNAKEGEEKKKKDPNVPDIVPSERLVYIPMTPAEVVAKIKALTPLEFGVLFRMITAQRNNLQASPAIAQIAIVDVKIAADAPLGLRRLYLYGKHGLSNSVVFEVADKPEDLEVVVMGKPQPTFRTITLPTVANGQVMPGQVDRLRFAATAGQTYSFDVRGRALVPFLGDAVPGWFQPIISVHDIKSGRQLALADDHLFDPDPKLSFTTPTDGTYELRIRDSIYRGREDFVYRIHASQGKPSKAQMGRPGRTGLSKVRENEPNDSTAKAMTVLQPALVVGTMQTRDDCDTFAFTGKKGQTIALEVMARRLNSPMDSVVKLLDAKGKVLAWNDDGPWPNIGIKTHHSDSFLTHKLPANGTYFAQVTDAQRKHGRDVRYFLQVRPAKPDFEVFLDPSTINCRTNSTVPVTLHVFRREGFKGAVNVSIKQGPANVRLAGGRFPAGVNTIRATVTLPPKIETKPYPIVLKATAKVQGRPVTHTVVASDEIMQAFLWTHFVPAEAALLYPCGRNWIGISTTGLRVDIPPGLTQKITAQSPYPLAKAMKRGTLRFSLNAPPKGLQLVSHKIHGKSIDLTFKADGDMAEWEGNLIIDVFIDIKKKGKAGKPKKFTQYLGCLPAIPTRIGEQRL